MVGGQQRPISTLKDDGRSTWYDEFIYDACATNSKEQQNNENGAGANGAYNPNSDNISTYSDSLFAFDDSESVGSSAAAEDDSRRNSVYNHSMSGPTLGGAAVEPNFGAVALGKMLGAAVLAPPPTAAPNRTYYAPPVAPEIPPLQPPQPVKVTPPAMTRIRQATIEESPPEDPDPFEIPESVRSLTSGKSYSQLYSMDNSATASSMDYSATVHSHQSAPAPLPPPAPTLAPAKIFDINQIHHEVRFRSPPASADPIAANPTGMQMRPNSMGGPGLGLLAATLGTSNQRTGSVFGTMPVQSQLHGIYSAAAGSRFSHDLGQGSNGAVSPTPGFNYGSLQNANAGFRKNSLPNLLQVQEARSAVLDEFDPLTAREQPKRQQISEAEARAPVTLAIPRPNSKKTLSATPTGSGSGSGANPNGRGTGGPVQTATGSGSGAQPNGRGAGTSVQSGTGSGFGHAQPVAVVGSKLNAVKEAVPFVNDQKCAAALNRCGGNVEAAARELKLEKLVDLGIAPKDRCRAALEKTNWDLDQAASQLLG